MMLHIPAVLSPDEVLQFREKLAGADWVDGRRTVGYQGALVKRNRQLQEDAPVSLELGTLVEHALKRSGLYFSAALPLRTSPILFNRYDSAAQDHYGFHVDGAMRGIAASPGWMRTDLSATLFLSEPESYEGGELTVSDTYGQHEVKLPAGDMILYPSTSLHGVADVVKGVRIGAFFWIQSMIRYDHQRTMLYELDQAIQALRAKHGESPQTLTLSNHYHNLLREWSQV